MSEVLPCVEPAELFFRPAAPTVEECVHMLLAHDEVCMGVSNRREIWRGARVIGYIRIVDLLPRD